MEDVQTIWREWGSWAGAALALAIALRTHASTSARTVRQLARWLDESKARIKRLEARIKRLEEHRDRLAAEVERLTPFERRAVCLAGELRTLHAAIEASAPQTQQRAISLVREPIDADVVQLNSPKREGEG